MPKEAIGATRSESEPVKSFNRSMNRLMSAVAKFEGVEANLRDVADRIVGPRPRTQPADKGADAISAGLCGEIDQNADYLESMVQSLMEEVEALKTF